MQSISKQNIYQFTSPYWQTNQTWLKQVHKVTCSGDLRSGLLQLSHLAVSLSNHKIDQIPASSLFPSPHSCHLRNYMMPKTQDVKDRIRNMEHRYVIFHGFSYGQITKQKGRNFKYFTRLIRKWRNFQPNTHNQSKCLSQRITSLIQDMQTNRKDSLIKQYKILHPYYRFNDTKATKISIAKPN